MANYSYISQYKRETIENQVKGCNEVLARFKALLNANGEGLKDAQRYAKEGADAEIIAKRAEVRAWMDKNEMPPYLREDYEERAVQSIGSERLKYLSQVAHALPIRCAGREIDLNKDIEEINGNWVLSATLVNSMLEEKRYTLTDEEMEDLKLCLQAGEIIRKVKARHIDINGLEWFGEWKSNETLAEGLMRSYVSEMPSSASMLNVGL